MTNAPEKLFVAYPSDPPAASWKASVHISPPKQIEYIRADLCQPKVRPTTDLIERAKGREQFLRDRGEIKSPDLIRDLIAAIQAAPSPEQLRAWAGHMRDGLAAYEMRAAADRMEGK
jgi:hypothetical protein